MGAIAAAAVGLGFAVWGSSRWDVLLHLLGWITFGSLAVGLMVDHEILSPLLLPQWLGPQAKFVANEVLEVLPGYPAVLSVSQFLLNCMGLFVLSSAKSKYTWTVFALFRLLFPVVSACENDIQPGGQSLLSVDYVLYCAFVYLSFIGPLASTQSRSFCLVDLALFVYFHTISPKHSCEGTEAAWLAILVCVGHDLVVHWQLFVLVETVLFSSGLMWALHVAVSFTGLKTGQVEIPPDAELTISLGLLFWALGMFVRTYSQGRVRFSLVLLAFAVPVLFYVTKSLPIAASGAVVCWALAKNRSWGRRKTKATRNWFNLQTTSLFPVMERDLIQDVLDREEEEALLQKEKNKQLSFEEAVSQFQAFSANSFDTKAMEEAKKANPNLKSAVETREDLIYAEDDKQRFLSKKIFYLEALSKGQVMEEHDATLKQLAQYKLDLKQSLDTQNRLLEG